MNKEPGSSIPGEIGQWDLEALLATMFIVVRVEDFKNVFYSDLGSSDLV